MSEVIIQNGQRFFKHEKGNGYLKEGVDSGGKRFAYTKCQFCERIISNCGWASKKHYQTHLKNNQVIPKTETTENK